MVGPFVRCLIGAVVAMSAVQVAHAAQQTRNAPQVTVKAGKVSTIQDLYAWDANCRPVPVVFKALKTSSGKLYAVPETYRIKGSAGDSCNGRTVSGKKIVFQPQRDFKGKTSVRYSVTAPKIKNTYVISRSIVVR
jgi:hypothetical protein